MHTEVSKMPSGFIVFTYQADRLCGCVTNDSS